MKKKEKNSVTNRIYRKPRQGLQDTNRIGTALEALLYNCTIILQRIE